MERRLSWPNSALVKTPSRIRSTSIRSSLSFSMTERSGQRMLFQMGSRLRQPMSGSERVTSTTGWTSISLAAQQVVILGAGLDTRAARKRLPGVAYFEIDDANTLSLKEARLADHKVPAEVTYIPGDYVATGVLDLLEKNGFKRELPTFFIWEGNTMYLTKGPVMQVLAELKESVPTFGLSFDFMDQAVVARTTGDAKVTTFVERFAAMGAPWLLGIDDLPVLAEEARLAVAVVTTVATLHRTYWPRRPLDSVMYEHYSLCTLKPA